MTEPSRGILLRRWLAWGLFWAYNAFILSGAVAPPHLIPRPFIFLNDKLIHGIEFFILYWIARNAFTESAPAFLSKRAWILAWGYGVLMGGFTELLQLYVPSRSLEGYDFLADVLGGSIALGMGYLAFEKNSRRKAKA